MKTLHRETRETRVRIGLDIRPDSAACMLDIPDRPLAHMLATLARYAGWRLEASAAGDLRHHLIEDTALTLGLALADAMPVACARYGHAVVPMDDALVQVTLDAGGRAFYDGPLPSRLFEHFFRSFASASGLTLHVVVQRGSDRHHIIEAAFKALGFALRQAMQASDAVFSTKGSIDIRRGTDD